MKIDKKLKLTSVKVLPEYYIDFKLDSENTGITLQKLVNRSIYLYQTNSDFKKLISETEDLINEFKNKKL